jgi:hypothetical protein
MHSKFSENIYLHLQSLFLDFGRLQNLDLPDYALLFHHLNKRDENM